MNVVPHSDGASFLKHAREWLERAEDEHNLVLSIASAYASPLSLPDEEAPIFVTVEDDGTIVGCAFRTPPHKLVLTRMPMEAATRVAGFMAGRYAAIPAVLGPGEQARAAAEEWVARRGGRVRSGMKQRLHRLDQVREPSGVPGRMRPAEREDLPLVRVWGEGFAADAGHEFATSDEARESWVSAGRLFLWEDGEPASMAVASGATRHGMRIGYVYTPPNRRRHGYATAMVAALSRALLEGGFDFCVLYTDLANPTSNAIYARVGYRPVCDIEDVVIEKA